jgi:pimeloyl-ACP methyl ester carboxylesterase
LAEPVDPGIQVVELAVQSGRQFWTHLGMTSHFTYTVHGSGHDSGPGPLLAHGAGGSAEANFGPVLPELAAGHTVVAPDYPGAGETPCNTGPLDLDMLADGLVASALHAGVERFGIVGYSLGTAVAVRAATRHPDRVTGSSCRLGWPRLTTVSSWPPRCGGNCCSTVIVTCCRGS